MVKALLAAALPALLYTSPLAGQRLQVQGNALLAGGKPIVLRGVAVGDPILARQGGRCPITSESPRTGMRMWCASRCIPPEKMDAAKKGS